MLVVGRAGQRQGERRLGGRWRGFRILPRRSHFRGSGCGLFGLRVGGDFLRQGIGVGRRKRLPHFLVLQLFDGDGLGNVRQ